MENKSFWIVRAGHEKIGPITWDRVIELRRSGFLRPTDVIVDQNGSPIVDWYRRSDSQRIETPSLDPSRAYADKRPRSPLLIVVIAIATLMGSVYLSQGPVGVTVLSFSPHAYDEVPQFLNDMDRGNDIRAKRSENWAEVAAVKAALWLISCIGFALYLGALGCALFLAIRCSGMYKAVGWLIVLICALMVVAAVVQRNSSVHHETFFSNFVHWRAD